MESNPQGNRPDNQMEYLENRLKELRDYVQKMEKENQELYDQLGISPHQAAEILNNKDNFSPELYAFITEEREALRSKLENRLEEIRKEIKKDTPPDSPPIGGHWILMR